MIEHSATWTIVGPDGQQVLLNDPSSGLYLENVTGFSDSPNVRTSIEDLPAEDGADAADSWYGSRPVTLTGKITGSTAADRNQNLINLKRAVRGLRGDVLLKSQASGLPAMQAKARLESFRASGGWVKDFQIGLVCADPLMYSQTLHTATASAAAVQGAGFPWIFPVNFGGGSGAYAELTISNAGTAPAPCVLRTWGTLGANFFVRNATTGDAIYVDGLALAAAEYVQIDTGARTAVRNNGTTVRGLVRFPDSIWLRLAPGSNAIQLRGSSSGTGVTLDVEWRDAWD